MEADAQQQAKGGVDVLQLSRPACVPVPWPWQPRKSADHVLGYQAILYPRHACAWRSRRPCRDGRCRLGHCRRAASHRFGGNRSGRPETGTGLFIPVLLGLQWHGSCRVRIPQRNPRRRLGRPCRSLADVGEKLSTYRDGQSGPAPPRRAHGPDCIGQFTPHRLATRHRIRSRSSPCSSGTWIPRIRPSRPPRQHAFRADSPPGAISLDGLQPSRAGALPSPAPRQPAALAFAKAGARVLGVGRRAEALRETADLRPTIETLGAAGAPERIVQAAVDRWGRVDVSTTLESSR